MRHYFFDASALVKFYALEAGSRMVRRMIQSGSAAKPDARLVVSELILPEGAAALHQVANGTNPAAHGLSRSAAARAFLSLKANLATESPFLVMGTTGLMMEAAELAWKHEIKGADAVHLATALFARTVFSRWPEFYFVSSDRRLNAAASAEGLEVLDPTV